MRHSSLIVATVLMAAGTLAVAVPVNPALAHEGAGIVGGFVSGFQHPLLGPDHVVAMVAVGLWGAVLGPPALWLLPIVFPLVMACGGALGVLGVPLPHVELGIAASAVVLGAMVALAVRPPLALAATVVGAFAVFHGYAHGVELPQAADPLAYSAGFVIATGLLHLTGIAIGLLFRWRQGEWLVRAGGAAIALSGVMFLTT